MKAKLFMLILATSFPIYSMAAPEVFFDEMTHMAGFTGLDSIPQKGDNCEIHEGIMLITGSQYSPSGRVIELLKLQRKDGQSFMIPTNFSKLSNGELPKSEEMSKEGGVVFIKFSACGSGGYLSLIDILKPL